MLTPKRLYSLNEAAKRTQCESSDILHAGALGAMTLLIGVPDGAQLRLINEHRLEQDSASPDLMCTPNLLILRKHHCLSLQLSGVALVDNFQMGYFFSPQVGVQKLDPKVCGSKFNMIDEEVNSSWTLKHRPLNAWSFFSDGAPSEMKISTDHVLISNEEIDRQFGIDPSKPGNVNEYYKSDFLQFMNQAAFFFWGNPKIMKEDKTTYPETTVIVNWFIKKGFSKRLAENAASILRPDFAGTGRPPIKDCG